VHARTNFKAGVEMTIVKTREREQSAIARLSASAFVETDEQGLVAEAQGGLTIAFERLVEKYERRVFRLAQNITRNREDAEDAMQNAFVKAFRKLSTFRGESSFYTWLVRITFNEALMGMRRYRRNVVSFDDSDESVDSALRYEFEGWGPSPEQCYSQTELQDILAKTIRGLSHEYRIVFQLRDIEGFSTRETANALSLSSAAVKSRLRRARLQLRGSLSRHFRSKNQNAACRLPKFRPPVISTRYGVAFHKQVAITALPDRHPPAPAWRDPAVLPGAAKPSI
jgi:RNA polymerase sigma-70 factor (ECF subfamily)